MRRSKYILPLFICALFFASVSTVSAQVERPPGGDQNQFEAPAGEQRPNLFRELGLSRDQMQRVRKLNQERKPLMQNARQKLREANRELDLAIYADSADEQTVLARLKDFQSAQAEVARLRFMNELAVRQLLTPDQLIKFRGLRQRFADAVRDRPETGNSDRQNQRRIRQQQRQFPNK